MKSHTCDASSFGACAASVVVTVGGRGVSECEAGEFFLPGLEAATTGLLVVLIVAGCAAFVVRVLAFFPGHGKT